MDKNTLQLIRNMMWNVSNRIEEQDESTLREQGFGYAMLVAGNALNELVTAIEDGVEFSDPHDSIAQAEKYIREQGVKKVDYPTKNGASATVAVAVAKKISENAVWLNNLAAVLDENFMFSPETIADIILHNASAGEKISGNLYHPCGRIWEVICCGSNDFYLTEDHSGYSTRLPTALNMRYGDLYNFIPALSELEK